jgi:hypothetical protein
MDGITTFPRIACDQEKFTAFAVTGINISRSSSVPASLGQQSQPDGSPRVALGLAAYDTTTGPEKTPRRNRRLYPVREDGFLLQYLVFDAPVPCSTGQVYANRLADIATVWFWGGDYGDRFTAVPLEARVTDAIRYSDLVQPPLEEDPFTGEVQTPVELVARSSCTCDTEWNRDRANHWQTLLNSRRLWTAVHFLQTSMNSYWRDFFDWEDCQRCGDPEPQIAPGPGDTAHQNAFKCVEEIVGGSLPNNRSKARRTLSSSLANDYGVNPGTRWRRMDTGEEGDIVEAILHVHGNRNRRSAHGGSAYKPPLKEAEILDAQYLARFLLVLCSKHDPSHQ